VFGEIVDLAPIAKKAHAHKALLIAVFTDPVALGAITSPGEQGADIVVGEGQGLGVGLNFGGPHVGLFACRQKLVRQMPGRVCGQTVDLLGDAGLKRMAALNHENACDLADVIDGVQGAEVLNETFFNEFTVKLDKPAAQVVEAMADRGVLGGVPFSRISAGQHEDLLLVKI